MMNPRTKAVFWALVPLLLLLPLFWWAEKRFEHRLAGEHRGRTQHVLDLQAGAVQKSFDRIAGKLEDLAAFVASETAGGRELDEERFNEYARGLHADVQWIRAFQIVSNGVVTHTYPLKGNEALRGYNLFTDPRPVIGGDVTRAQQTGRVTITGPLELVQGGLGIIIRKPLTPSAGSTARLVAIVLNIAPLLAESGISGQRTNDLQLAIRREAGEVFQGPPAVFEDQPVTCRIALPDGAWEMGSCPAAGWEAALHRPVLLFRLAGGSIIFLLCLLVFALVRSHANLLETVRQRTEALRNELGARRQAEEQLRRNYFLLQAVTEGTSDAVFVKDLLGCYQMINSAGAQFLGKTPEAIIGKNDLELFSAETAKTIMEGDRRVIESGRLHTFEEQETAGGITRIYQATKAPWRDEHGQVIGVVGVSRDITGRKQTETALQESETRYRFLFQHNPMPMLIYERGTLQMLAVNEAFNRHYGYNREEALALRLTDLYPDAEKAKIAELITRLRGHADVGEWHHRRRDGTFITIMASSHDLTYKGRTARVAVMTDITERKRAEEELQATKASLEERVLVRTTELAEAKERAESADRLKSAFLATMSHELRTPLNSIIGFTGILLQELAGPLNAEQAKQLRIIQNSGRHLLTLINAVMDISKIEAGQIEIFRLPFDLRESIEHVVQTVSPLAGKKNLKLVARLSPEVGTMVSDRRRVEQILLNLLNNAIKFTEQGEITLTAEVAAPAASDPATGRVLHLTVRDTGIGIKPEDLSKLFHPFRQIDSGLTRQHEGTGLGLAICKRLAERLGGEIHVESAWGQGSMFRVALPFESAPAATRDPGPAETLSGHSPSAPHTS